MLDCAGSGGGVISSTILCRNRATATMVLAIRCLAIDLAWLDIRNLRALHHTRGSIFLQQCTNSWSTVSLSEEASLSLTLSQRQSTKEARCISFFGVIDYASI